MKLTKVFLSILSSCGTARAGVEIPTAFKAKYQQIKGEVPHNQHLPFKY